MTQMVILDMMPPKSQIELFYHLTVYKLMTDAKLNC